MVHYAIAFSVSKRGRPSARHFYSVRREPLLLPATAFACGILFAHLLGIEWRYLIWPVSLCLLLAAIVALSPPAKRLRLAVLCCGLALAGVAVEIGHRQTRTPKLNAGDGDTVLLTGCVTNPPVFSPAREQFTLNLTPKAAARISVNLKPDDHPLALNYGQKVELPAKIRAPRNFQNPDSFDYVHYNTSVQISCRGDRA
jgi:hypothetical protein